MKSNSSSLTSRIALLATTLLAAGGLWANAAVTMQLDRDQIHQDETAQLTVNASSTGGDAISPPVVPGLEFSAVDQSTQMEIINGATTETSSITYEVTAQAPGTYTIPTQDSSGKNLTLQVLPGTAPSTASASSGVSNPSPSLPPPVVNGSNPGTPDAVANGAPFVRMDVPKHQLYVGETVPVTIQIGFPAGAQPTLNGLPTLTADAFTLDKLSDKPDQSQEDINGQPYIIVTWHSALAAIKPGNFPLAVTTPVTIQERVAPTRPSGDGADDSGLDSFFNNPFFQNAMGQVVQKNLNLASTSETISVLPLPANGQPANFGGAVGKFEISSAVTPSSAAAGDPMTLRLKIKGTGSFDRVSTSMLSNVAGWKTYPPSAKFVPSDSVGYSGEKDFEQPVIPLNTGRQSLPALSFSFFNPESRQYETVLANTSAVDVSPGTNPVVGSPAVTSPAVASTTAPVPSDGLRSDEVETGAALRTLRPLYFQAGFLLGQGVLALAFIGSGFWLRRRALFAADQGRVKRQLELQAVDGFLAQMDAAANHHDAATFFLSARQALQHCLAWRWNMMPGAVTVAEIDTHLNGSGENVRQVFALADQLAYSDHESIEADFSAWKQTVHQLVKQAETL